MRLKPDDDRRARRRGTATNARTVHADFDQYLGDATEGRIKLRPGTLRNSRSGAMLWPKLGC